MQGRLAPIRLDNYQPLREVVCETLREAIRTGALAPGERLMEIQLAEELGVSRTPVREAIRKLELEGYVIMLPRRGTYVASLSIRDINEVFEIRSALDTLASGLAAERITSEELDRLKDLLGQISQHIEDCNMEKIVEIDTEFHDVLYQASRNSRLFDIIANLREQLTRFRTISMSYPGRLKQTLKEHGRLVDAIACRDSELARKIAAEHMENSEQALLMDIKASQPEQD